MAARFVSGVARTAAVVTRFVCQEPAANRSPLPLREALPDEPASEPITPHPFATEPHSARIVELEKQLADERHRRELAEAVSAEQARHLADLRTALNMLNPGPPTKRKRWWRRNS